VVGVACCWVLSIIINGPQFFWADVIASRRAERDCRMPHVHETTLTVYMGAKSVALFFVPLAVTWIASPCVTCIARAAVTWIAYCSIICRARKSLKMVRVRRSHTVRKMSVRPPVRFVASFRRYFNGCGSVYVCFRKSTE